jgi:hypothetical protein
MLKNWYNDKKRGLIMYKSDVLDIIFGSDRENKSVPKSGEIIEIHGFGVQFQENVVFDMKDKNFEVLYMVIIDCSYFVDCYFVIKYENKSYFITYRVENRKINQIRNRIKESDFQYLSQKIGDYFPVMKNYVTKHPKIRMNLLF